MHCRAFCDVANLPIAICNCNGYIVSMYKRDIIRAIYKGGPVIDFIGALMVIVFLVELLKGCM